MLLSLTFLKFCVVWSSAKVLSLLLRCGLEERVPPLHGAPSHCLPLLQIYIPIFSRGVVCAGVRACYAHKLTFPFCHGVLSPTLSSCTILSQKNIQPVCTRRSLCNITPHQEKPSALFHQTVHLINIISEWDADCNGGQDLMP